MFLVAWRRLDDMPDGVADARPWRFGVARATMLNLRRGDRRREALAVRIADARLTEPASASDDLAGRLDLAAGWDRLSGAEQEVISLAVWEGLDAADHRIDEAQRTRAAATLERILATDLETPTASAPIRTPRGRKHHRLLAGGVVAAAFTAAVVAVPVLTGGSEAFATWIPTPVELTGAERTAAVDACLVLQGDGGGELDFDSGAAASILVAEARGGWSYVIFRVAGPTGLELQGSCLVPDDLVADPRPGEGGFFGSLGGADETAGLTPPRDVAREDTYGVGSVDGETFVYAEGRAGVDVADIEVTTPGGLEVEASIDNGRWAVWWPAGDDSPSNPEMSGAPTYEVTLRDGTVTDGVRTNG